MLENILYYLQTYSWFPTDNGVAMPGVQPLLVFGLMVVAMFVRGTSLPTRGELVEQRLPLAPRARAGSGTHGAASRRPPRSSRWSCCPTTSGRR